MTATLPFRRALGATGLEVSALGLGTVKFGRNTGVKYPASFDLPSAAEISGLLAVARELGINLLDTAPAYGSSEERIGKLLVDRHEWILASKVGEEFDGSVSRFDFSAGHTRTSVESSLRRLRTDYLDLVLIHSDGNDVDILLHSDCVEELRTCQQRGLIRAIGMSSKTIAGGCLAAELLDVVMVTFNLQQQDTAVVEQASALGKGILVKKALMSGHIDSGSAEARDLVLESLQLNLQTPGIHALIFGTLRTTHLRSNVAKALQVLG